MKKMPWWKTLTDYAKGEKDKFEQGSMHLSYTMVFVSWISVRQASKY
jgi:hypothetical protein